MPDDTSDMSDRTGPPASSDSSGGSLGQFLSQSGQEAPGQPKDLEEASRILASKGITEDTLLTDGAAFHEAASEWQCKVCKAYNSSAIDDAGVVRIVPEKSLFCWNCGHSSWNSVEGGYHDPKVLELVGPPRPGIYRPPSVDLLQAIRTADAAIDECELFPEAMTQEDKEPHWPHDLAVSILGAAIHLSEELRMIDETLGWIATTGNTGDHLRGHGSDRA